MAKKKLTHQTHAPEQQNPSEKHEISNPLTRQPSMEDPAAEKMQSLKSLNSMLLKETFERRQQAGYLEKAKAELESQLTRSDSQKMDLASELAREGDKNLGLELERYLLSAFLETQIKEMGVGFGNLVKGRADQESEIRSLKKQVDVLKNGLESERDKVSRAYRERDSAESDLRLQVEEASRLKGRVIQMEETERQFEEEIGTLKNEQNCLKNEKISLQKGMEDARREKELVGQELDAMVKKSESLNINLQKVVSEKKEAERQMVEQRAEIDESKKERKELDELVSRFKKKEQFLQGKVLELEKSWAEAKEERTAEVDALVQEKRATEGYIQRLIEEKETVSRKFEMATADLEESQRTVERLVEETGAFKRNIHENEKEMNVKEQRIQELCREIDETERLRAILESANVELQAEVRKQQDEVSRLQEAYSIEERKNKELISEAERLTDALNKATLDRDGVLRGLEEEREKGLTLMVNASEMTKKMEETSEQLNEGRNTLTKLMEEKTGMGSVMRSLREDKDKLQKELSEAKEATTDLRGKVEAASGNADQAFTLLKKTASLLCDLESRNGKNMVEEKHGNEIEAYAAELEAIKKAFRNKETSIDEMKLEMKSMENSMAQVQKKKNFWTLFSSFTAFFAAASFAYVTRIR